MRKRDLTCLNKALMVRRNFSQLLLAESDPRGSASCASVTIRVDPRFFPEAVGQNLSHGGNEQMDEKTLRGLCVFALAVVVVATGYAPTSTPQPPPGWECNPDDGTCRRVTRVSTAATEAEPASEPEATDEPTVPVVEYTFSDDEALVIEGCLPPVCDGDPMANAPVAVLTYDAERGTLPFDVVESVRPYVAEPSNR
ncbi:hypothetical protein HY635_00985 [Candidatus Uhrbacteria bacterium]|nr:hypothetical protein [Candidatus Uhrbacteria bacterium]